MKNAQLSQSLVAQSFLSSRTMVCQGKNPWVFAPAQDISITVGYRGMMQTVSVSLLLLLGLVIFGTGAVKAQTPTPESAPASPQTQAETPPAELTTALTQIDAAANQRDLRGVMQVFSNTFTHSDGLNYRSMEEALSKFWQRYPTLTYQTELDSWTRDGGAIVAETTTTITGTQTINGQEFTLNAAIASRQRFENGRIVRQDILTERSQLTSGVTPPTVSIMLPEQVTIGRSFNFDAVVQEPLDNRLLLGAAIEEPIQPNGYLTATPINLELLSAGGLFKVGRAPALTDSRWISAVIIRNDGITMETRRLRVVGRQQ